MDPAVTSNAVRTGQQQPIKAAGEARADSGALVSSDFETFLRLLTTQLENQDPLNPMESSEFAVQLATFSGVEQQVRTNDLLSDLVGQSAAGGLADLAGWVGKQARSPATLHFDGTSLQVAAPVIPGADRAMLVVSNDAGEELGRQDIPNDGAPITWLGTGTDGTPLPPGDYTFAVEGFAGQSRVARVPIETYGTVAEVRMAEDGPRLVMTDGSEVRAADVTAVR
jgi:flagellar basal-body rod modification protein FlgD